MGRMCSRPRNPIWPKQHVQVAPIFVKIRVLCRRFRPDSLCTGVGVALRECGRNFVPSAWGARMNIAMAALRGLLGATQLQAVLDDRMMDGTLDVAALGGGGFWATPFRTSEPIRPTPLCNPLRRPPGAGPRSPEAFGLLGSRGAATGIARPFRPRQSLQRAETPSLA